MSEAGLSAEERSKIDELYELAIGGTYYELLGVSPSVDARAVQAAYYDLSRIWHPDRFFRRELGNQRERLETVFACITRAYKTLTDEASRARYHREMEEKGIKFETAPSAATASTTSVPPGGPRPTQPPPPRAAPPPVEHVATLSRAAPAGAPPPRAAPPRPTSRLPDNKLVQQIREQVREQREKARRYYQTGKEDYDAGRFLKAATGFKPALELDPKNEALQAIYEEARVKGQAQQVEIYLAKAKTATDSRQEAVAISFLKQAIPYDPADPSAFFRVGMWALNKENDQRTALQLLRRAVEKAPLNADYRVALGDL